MGNKRTTLSRPQVAALLSMSESEVRRLDGDRLHPHKGADGGWLYKPEEVSGVLRQLAMITSVGSRSGIDMAVSAEGGIAADAFLRFEKGEGTARVVIDMRLNPMLVQDLRRTYNGMTRELTVSSTDRQDIERLAGRPIACGRDITAVMSHLSRSRSTPSRTVADPTPPGDDDYGAILDPETGEKRVLTKEDVERSMASLTKLRSGSEGTGPKNVATDATQGDGSASVETSGSRALSVAAAAEPAGKVQEPL